jgi:hypothetical protein
MEPSETEDCPLCYNTMNDETPKKQLTCNHRFHKDCIEDTIIFNIEHSLPILCPLCRNVINITDYPPNWRDHLPVLEHPPIPPRRIITMQDWPFDITAPSDYIRLNPEDSLEFKIKISRNEPLRLVNNQGTTIVNIGELCPIHSIDQIEIPPNEQNTSIETIEELAKLSWRNLVIADRDVYNAKNYNNAIFKRNLEIILRRQQLPIEEAYNQRILAIANAQYSKALELYDLMKIRRRLAETTLYYLDKKNSNNSLAQIIDELPTQSTTISGLQELYDNATELKQRAEDHLRTINYMPIQENNYKEVYIEANKKLKSITDYHYNEVLSEASENLKSITDYQANIKSQLDNAKTRIGSIKLSLRNRTKSAKKTLATIEKRIIKSIKKSIKKAKQLKNRLLMLKVDEDLELLGGKHKKSKKAKKTRKRRKVRKH